MKTPAGAASASTKVAVPWNIAWAIALVAVLYVGAPVISGLLVTIYPALQHWSATRIQDWLNNSTSAQFLYVLLTEIFTIGGVLLFVRNYKFSVSGLGLKKPQLRDLLIGVGAYVVYFFVAGIALELATRLFTGLNVNEKQQLGFNNVHGTWPLIMTFISLVILPPLAEEILVRGFLFTSLRRYFKFGLATLVTSAAFAAAHLPEGGAAGPLYVAAVDTFVLSLVLCALREKTGSLWPGITLHGLKNLIAFASLFIFVSH